MINTIPTCVHSLTVIFQIQLRVLLCPVLPAELVNFHHIGIRGTAQKADAPALATLADKTEALRTLSEMSSNFGRHPTFSDGSWG